MTWQTRNWLITGANGGFGRAFVAAVIQGGGQVVALTRDADRLADQAHPRLHVISADITRRDDLARAVAQAQSLTGGIDVVVNNAGYGLLGGIEECDEAQIRALFEVNIFAAINLTRLVLPQMRQQERGYVVNISSVSGIKGIAGSGYYNATKFVLEGFSEALSQEGKECGIRTLIVEPGAYRTGFMDISRDRAKVEIPAYAALARRRAAEAQRPPASGHSPTAGVAAIIKAMNEPNPPLRLPLGPEAAAICAETHQRRLREVETWRPVSEAAT